jgi:FtsX-like permease family
MIRLGLQLTLHSGREALTRLLVTTLAVAVGSTILLAVLADFRAFQASSGRACWECTQGIPAAGQLPAGARGELWNYSVDFYRGQTIERLDVAALGPAAPVPPGVSRLPGPGEYFASPALARLLRTVPPGELGDRFPGRLAGTIGRAALSGPRELAVYAGYQPSALTHVLNTRLVTAIQASPGPQLWTPFFRNLFLAGVLAVLFPILILIGTATRLAAARREERLAALRLAGATPRDVAALASVESVLSALAGTLLGIVGFLLIRPALAGAALLGSQYFAAEVTPAAGDYLVMLVAVPVAAAGASLLALRRVRVSPLGVSRRVRPPRPRAWRLTTLVAGLVLFTVGLLATTHQGIGGPVIPALLLVMAGLVAAGPWLTEAAARLCARIFPGGAALLATRRVRDNPKAAFRSVSGLVLAVFLGTMVGALLPSVESFTATPAAAAMADVLLDPFAQTGIDHAPAGAPAGLSPRAGARLLRQLAVFRGARVFPLYATPQSANPNYQGGYVGVVGCSMLRQLAVLGQCRPGAAAVQADDSALVYSDNPHFSTAPFVSRANPAYTGSVARLPLQAVLVKVDGPVTLERVRTFLATHAPPAGAIAAGQAPTPPRTYGEAVAIRSARAVTVERVVYAAVALTLVTAGCSLAVAVAGGLVERRRPFTLLRVNGTPTGTLYRAVLLEAVFPLAAATVVAAGVAYGMSVLAFARIAPPGTALPVLGHVYYETLGAGLGVSLLVIMAALPLLGRLTSPGSVRFE